jgi:hypothetical protein
MDTVMVSGVPLTVAVPVVVMVPVPAFDDDPEAGVSNARMAGWLPVEVPPGAGGGLDVREAECPHPPSASMEAAAITAATGINRVV